MLGVTHRSYKSQRVLSTGPKLKQQFVLHNTKAATADYTLDRVLQMEIGKRWQEVAPGGRVRDYALIWTQTFRTPTVGNKTSGSKVNIITTKVEDAVAVCD